MDNKKNILIVEDDLFVSRAYTIKFEKENFNVSSVGDGEAAIEFLKKNPLPDLILLDLMIPKKSGFDVLKEIKENKDWKKISVIILSNLGQEEDIKKGSELGAVDYIVKAETNIEDVVTRIKKFL